MEFSQKENFKKLPNASLTNREKTYFVCCVQTCSVSLFSYLKHVKWEYNPLRSHCRSDENKR